MTEKYFERIGYNGDSAPLIADISNGFGLGTVLSSGVMAVGFEDCNVMVQTDTGQFVIKAFGKFRNDDAIDRYVEVMKVAIAGGVHHPALYQAKEGNVLLRHTSGVAAVVMDFIDGHTYFDTKTVPTDEELVLVAAEAVKIHALDIDPPQAEDLWAIPNIHGMFGTTTRLLDERGKQLVDQAIDRYDAIDQEQLTKCFVHGDITSTNTLIGIGGKVWIIDFAVSNVYPKIQELAVIATSLLADNGNFVLLSERVEKVRKAQFVAGGTLTDYEQRVLLDYAIAGAAMWFMGGLKSKFIDKEDPNESDYWINLGERALVEELAKQQ